jgi:hypothetical protein
MIAPEETHKGRRSSKIGEKDIGGVISGFALRFFGWSNSLTFRGSPGVDGEGTWIPGMTSDF